MSDTLTVKERSQRMALVQGADTRPELLVRRLIHGMGYRYRLHAKELPGRPDIVFRKRRKVIFVNGCFWHRHQNCRLARLPKSRSEFWLPKLEGNRQRDAKNIAALKAAGWMVLVIWECELGDRQSLVERLKEFLENEEAGSR
jgi:DNA mismatch endonuclease, patch repair protein